MTHTKYPERIRILEQKLRKLEPWSLSGLCAETCRDIYIRCRTALDRVVYIRKHIEELVLFIEKQDSAALEGLANRVDTEDCDDENLFLQDFRYADGERKELDAFNLCCSFYESALSELFNASLLSSEDPSKLPSRFRMGGDFSLRLVISVTKDNDLLDFALGKIEASKYLQ